MSVNTQTPTIQKFEIYSQTPGKSVSVDAGSPRIEYRESMIDNTIRLTSYFIEGGDSVNDGSKTISALESLNIQGAEKVLFKCSDKRGNILDLSKDTSLRVSNRVHEYKTLKSTSYILQMVSKEFFDNKELERAVLRKYTGKISDSVNKILKEDLKTDKDLFISPTLKDCNDFGLRKPPFEVILELQQLAIPAFKKSENKTAGFFFWQTSKGFYFKSPDEIFNSKPIKKYIYNLAVDREVPDGYTDKIKQLYVNRSVDVERQMDHGAYGTVTETFDFYSLEVNKNAPLLAQEAGKVLSGKELPKYGDYFKKPTKYLTIPEAIGMAYMTGDSIDLQLDKSKKENFSVETIAQAVQNYRQRLNYMIEVVIDADFSLQAGDLIRCDLPPLSSSKTPEPNAIDSGIYMILELCHFISPSAMSAGTDSSFYTGLVLVRDSYGIKN